MMLDSVNVCSMPLTPALAKLVLKVKAELDQLGDLLNFDSTAFCNTRWKVRMPVTSDF